MLSVNPIDLGIVYVEQDSGTDSQGDLFELTWTGGAADTQLTTIIIDGDQNINGFGVGDVFFDTSSAGFGADTASAFELGSHDGIDGITATVEDGGTRLVLEFTGYEADERLFFEIDVDEVEDFSADESDLVAINDGFDPITSGVEFQGSFITADFAAPRHFDLTETTEFRNRYDDTLAESELNLPADNANEQRDRSAGAFLVDIQQLPLPASLSGNVYHDRDNDGVIDPGDEGISNVFVSLVDENGVIVDAQLTNDDGFYEFNDVAEGTYSIVETQPAGWTDGLETAGMIGGVVVGSALNPGDTIEQISVLPGDAGVEYNFGEYFSAEINGRVQESSRDGDCFGNMTEHAPIAGAIVQLLDADGNVIDETTTDENGEYSFTGLVPGEYGLREITPDEFVDGAAQPGNVDGDAVGDVDPMGAIRSIQLNSGEVAEDFIFCDHRPARIGGTVFHDEDGDGIQDPGEEGIPGVEIQLIDEDGNVVQTVFTDENGNYEFTGVTPGTYMIREIQPDGFTDGEDSVGDINGETNGDLDPGGDKINNIEIGWGDEGTDYDFAEQLPGTISGRVHSDTVLDCEFDADAGEILLAGVIIELIDADGNVVATTTTNDAGEYFFDTVAPGTYSLRETQPEDFFDSGSTTGSAGGDNTSPNVITGVTVGSGAELTDYNFCEQAPVLISGFVFQDGDIVDLPFGEELPERVGDIRDGVRSSDDTFLPGIVLELRDGTTGEALSPADFALEGLYPGDTITTTTDANGFYEFSGLLASSYSVYEQQPTGFVDGVDTPGTSDGFVFNPGEATQDSVFLALEVDPQNDGIVRINVAPGQQAVENNFSEILVNQLAEPPAPPPITPPVLPPFNPPPFNPPRTPTPPSIGPGLTFTSFNPLPAAPGGGSYTPQSGGGGGNIAKPRSWHLSIINGGQPRNDNGATIEDSIWLAAGRVFAADAVRQGEWIVDGGYGNTDSVGRSSVFFGLPGAIPVAGDFNGDGYDEIGVYAEGEWFIDINGNGEWDANDLWAKLGNRKDHPVTGDWDGDGKCDIGIFGREWQGDNSAVAAEPGLPDEDNRTYNEKKNVPRKDNNDSERQRAMRRGQAGKLRADVIDHTFRFGRKADYPLTGDWNGDGITTIGIFREGVWKLDVDGNGRWSTADEKYQFGEEGDTPLVGDFDGDGIDDLAVFRAGVVIIDTNSNGAIDSSDRRITIGRPGDQPVVGDFDGDGVDEIVIYRPGAEPQSVVYEARKTG